MSDTEKGYEGWANYETWAVALWLGNERASCDHWREQAAGIWEGDGVPRRQPHWTRSETARFNLADQLKADLTDGAGQALKDDGGTLWRDLLQAALDEVDWHEVADAFLTDLDGYESEAA